MRGTKEGGGLWQNAILFGDLGEGQQDQADILPDGLEPRDEKDPASLCDAREDGASPPRCWLSRLMCLLLPCALREVLLRCFPP